MGTLVLGSGIAIASITRLSEEDNVPVFVVGNPQQVNPVATPEFWTRESVIHNLKFKAKRSKGGRKRNRKTRWS